MKVKSNYLSINLGIGTILKGVAMGVANVIPGVSTGTVAFIMGIYGQLIEAIKSFNIAALKLLLRRQYREFAVYVKLGFLVRVLFGVSVGIFTLARLLEYMFEHQATWFEKNLI